MWSRDRPLSSPEDRSKGGQQLRRFRDAEVPKSQVPYYGGAWSGACWDPHPLFSSIKEIIDHCRSLTNSAGSILLLTIFSHNKLGVTARVRTQSAGLWDKTELRAQLYFSNYKTQRLNSCVVFSLIQIHRDTQKHVHAHTRTHTMLHCFHSSTEELFSLIFPNSLPSIVCSGQVRN